MVCHCSVCACDKLVINQGIYEKTFIDLLFGALWYAGSLESSQKVDQSELGFDRTTLEVTMRIYSELHFLLLLELILHSLISIQNDFPLSSCCKKRLLMWTWWPKLSCSLFCSSSSCCVISVQQRLSLSLRLWRTAQRRGWTLYAILHGCYAHWLLCYLEWFIANIILMYFNNRHT